MHSTVADGWLQVLVRGDAGNLIARLPTARATPQPVATETFCVTQLDEACRRACLASVGRLGDLPESIDGGLE